MHFKKRIGIPKQAFQKRVGRPLKMALNKERIGIPKRIGLPKTAFEERIGIP